VSCLLRISGAARLRPLGHDRRMSDLHVAAERRIGAPAEQVYR